MAIGDAAGIRAKAVVDAGRQPVLWRGEHGDAAGREVTARAARLTGRAARRWSGTRAGAQGDGQKARQRTGARRQGDAAANRWTRAARGVGRRAAHSCAHVEVTTLHESGGDGQTRRQQLRTHATQLHIEPIAAINTYYMTSVSQTVYPQCSPYTSVKASRRHQQPKQRLRVAPRCSM